MRSRQDGPSDLSLGSERSRNSWAGAPLELRHQSGGRYVKKELKAKSGKDFDRAHDQMQVQAHEEADSASVRPVLTYTLPTSHRCS